VKRGKGDELGEDHGGAPTAQLSWSRSSALCLASWAVRGGISAARRAPQHLSRRSRSRSAIDLPMSGPGVL